MPDLIDLYAEDLRTRGRMDSSLRVMTSNLRTVADDCGPLDTLTSEQVTNWLDTRRTNSGAPVASNTRWGYISGLNRFYQWAIDAGHLSSNPVEGMAKPPLEETTTHVVTTAEVETAIDQATGELRCWLIVAAYQGLRPQEVALLERDNIDTTATPPTLRVRSRSGATDRTIELHPRTLAALEALPMPEEGRLFPSTNAGLVARRIGRHLSALGLDVRADALRTWYKSDEYWAHEAAVADRGSSAPQDVTQIANVPLEASVEVDRDFLSYPLVIDSRTRRMLRHSLASRKAVVLIGPPGTGKTRLASETVTEIADDPRSIGLSRPPKLSSPVTPDESWTATEIVGGPTVHNGDIIFRPGYMLKAIQDDAWLLLDEANRADLDKILGGLLTWLAESTIDVVIGHLSEAPGAPEVTVGWNTHPASAVINGEWLDDPLHAPIDQGPVRFLAGQEWRLLATYNAVDAQRVFRFGQALGRRFATVPLSAPDIEVVQDLLVQRCTEKGLPPGLAATIAGLYGAHLADPETTLGPAPFLEIPGYISSIAGSTDEEFLIAEELEDALAEGYLVNTGLFLARLGGELKTLGERVEDAGVFSPGTWQWVTDQLTAFR